MCVNWWIWLAEAGCFQSRLKTTKSAQFSLCALSWLIGKKKNIKKQEYDAMIYLDQILTDSVSKDYLIVKSTAEAFP